MNPRCKVFAVRDIRIVKPPRCLGLKPESEQEPFRVRLTVDLPRDPANTLLATALLAATHTTALLATGTLLPTCALLATSSTATTTTCGAAAGPAGTTAGEVELRHLTDAGEEWLGLHANIPAISRNNGNG